MLGGIAAHNQNTIGILYINVMVRHGTASKRLSQSRHRWTVSDTGLMIYIDHTQSTAFSSHQPALFIINV